MQTQSLNTRVLRILVSLILCVAVAAGYHGYREYEADVRDREIFLDRMFSFLVKISVYADSWLEDPEGTDQSIYSFDDIIYMLRDMDMYCKDYTTFANRGSTASDGIESFGQIALRFTDADNRKDIELSKNLIEALRDGSLQLLSGLSTEGGINMDNIYDRQQDCNLKLSTERTNDIFKDFFVRLGKKDLLYKESSFKYGTEEA